MSTQFTAPQLNCPIFASALQHISSNVKEFELGAHALRCAANNSLLLEGLTRFVDTNNNISVAYLASCAIQVLVYPTDGRQVVSFTTKNNSDPLDLSNNDNFQKIFKSMYNRVDNIQRNRKTSSPSSSGNTSPTSVAALTASTHQPVVSSMNVGKN